MPTRAPRSTVLGLVVLLSSSLSSSNPRDQSEGLEEPAYQQLSRVIIRLESTGEGKAVGTAFFVGHENDRRFNYLVTARHVVESRLALRARVPSQRKDSGDTEVIELRIPGKAWVFHPSPPRTVKIGDAEEELFPVDVAVAKVPPIKERRVRTVGYCMGECPSGRRDQFLDTNPVPPLRVLVWGFPLHLGFTLEVQRPVARLGLVALVADEPYIRTRIGTKQILRDERVLLLDAPIFPGNSGGPVFDYPPRGLPQRLAGLVSAANSSLNFAIAEPVSRIAETIDAAYEITLDDLPSWHLLAPSL